MAGEGVSISQGGEVHRLIAVQGVGQVGEGELAGDLVDGIIEGTQVLVVRFLQRPPAVAVVHRAGKAPQVDAPPQIGVHLQHRPAGEVQGPGVVQGHLAVGIGKGAAAAGAEGAFAVKKGDVQVGSPVVDGVQGVVRPLGPLIGGLRHGGVEQEQQQGHRRKGDQGKPGGALPVPPPGQGAQAHHAPGQDKHHQGGPGRGDRDAQRRQHEGSGKQEGKRKRGAAHHRQGQQNRQHCGHCQGKDGGGPNPHLHGQLENGLDKAVQLQAGTHRIHHRTAEGDLSQPHGGKQPPYRQTVEKQHSGHTRQHPAGGQGAQHGE